MSHTKQRAGRLVAVYVDDHQGRRLVLADDTHDSGFVLDRVLVVGTTKREVRATISTLEQLSEELPP